MRVATELTEGRPVPAIDPVSQPYWEFTLDGVLSIQHCGSCGSTQFYPRPICVTCGAVPALVPASGRGTVHTFSIIRQNGMQPFKQQLPYVVAIVELEEGPRLMSNIIDCDVDAVEIGSAVEVEFVRLNDEAALPFFRLVS